MVKELDEADFDEGRPRSVKEWKDPTCPKCGIVLGNKMMYCCREQYCPVGLNG